MITKVKLKNGSPEWKAFRGQYIGGSDSASCVNLGYKSQFALVAEKLGLVPAFEGNRATRRGTWDEEFVAKEFEMESGKKVRKTSFTYLNDKYPWAVANVDRFIVGENAGLEIKTTDSLNMRKFKNGEFPANYYCQCMHYMTILEIPKWYLAVAIGQSDLKIFEIEWNEEEAEALMEAEREVWEMIQAGKLPAADGNPTSSSTLKALYPQDTDDEPIYIDECSEDAKNYLLFDKLSKDYGKQRDACKNRIAQVMQTSSIGYAVDHKITYKGTNYSTFDLEKFKEDHPDIDLTGYYKDSFRRTMRITEIKKEKK